MDIIILEIAGMKGNCTFEGHVDQIILHSFSHSVSLPMQGDKANTERTAGRPNFSEMNFSKMSDIATPALYDACASGKKLGVAKIHIGRTEGAKFMSLLEYELTDAMVSNISTQGGGSDPSDSFTLNYNKITQVFHQQNPDSTKKGAAAFGWDLVKNIAATPKV